MCGVWVRGRRDLGERDGQVGGILGRYIFMLSSGRVSFLKGWGPFFSFGIPPVLPFADNCGGWGGGWGSIGAGWGRGWGCRLGR